MARIIRTYASSNLLHVTPAQPLKPEIYDRPCTPEPFLPPLRRTDSTETLRATATRNRGRPHRQHSRSRVTLNGHKDEESLYKFPKKRSSSTDTIRAQKAPGKGLNTEDSALENGDDIVVYPCPDDDIPNIPDEDNLLVPIPPPRTFLAPRLPLPTHFFGQKLPLSRRADLCSLTSRRLVPERFSLPQKLRVRDVCADDNEPNVEDNGSRRSKTAAIRPTVWDMNVSLTFYEKSGQFFDIWDMDDSQVITIPARMHFILKDPERWDGVPMENTPDIRYIDFRCQSFDYDPLALSKTPPNPNPNPELEPNYMQSDFYVDYRGPIAWGKSDGSQGICAFPVWRKTTSVNWFMRKRRCKVRCLPARKNYEFEFSDGEEEEDWDDAEELMQDGWYLKFMIPIPVSLFRVKQTRAFRAEASAWTGGEEGGGVLMADTDFMVSHLRLKEIAKR